MSGFTAAGINTTTVTTTQQAPLGFELTVPTANAGNQTWVYVLANDALIEGKIAMLENAASAFEVNVTPTGLSVNVTAERVVGVAQHAIAAASYGFVLAKGFGSVKAGSGAALTVNTAVTMGGGTVTGTALDFAAGTTAPACIIGHCTVGATATNNATCYINVT